MKVTAEFTGGLEYLFGGHKTIPLELQSPAFIRDVVAALVSDHLKERKELFIAENTV